MSCFRRLPAVFLALVLLLLSVMSAAHAREMVSVARPEINLRTGPGTRYTANWALSSGYPLEVLSRKGGWLQVRDFENDRGWVLGRLVNHAPHYVVKAKVANLRSRPSTRSRISGKLLYGDVLRTLARRGEWIKVQRKGGGSGWVAKRLLWGW